MKIVKRIIIGFLAIVALIFISGYLFVNLSPAFGDNASGESLEKIQSSRNFDGEKFKNLVPTEVSTPDPNSEQHMAGVLYGFFFPPEGKNPESPLPSEQLEGSVMENGDFAWLDHSTILMKIDNKVIITDPVFNNASPLPFSIEPFDMEKTPRIEDLPSKIDVVLISHDHYDHLDYKAIQELDKRTGKFFVPLGVKAHLLYWGIDESKIEEKNWYEKTTDGSLRFTYTPSRHFSGRGFSNRFSTLWGSWVIQSDSLSIFFSGDSGYFDEFKKIGERFGPFDIAFMENGAYNTNWSQIHFMPEESVQASIDLQARKMFPIHWGKFDLSVHPWKEPIQRASKSAKDKGVTLVTPLIGEVFTLDAPPQRTWWDF